MDSQVLIVYHPEEETTVHPNTMLLKTPNVYESQLKIEMKHKPDEQKGARTRISGGRTVQLLLKIRWLQSAGGRTLR